MKKRSREGPFDGEGMDYFQVPITDAALPVIPAEGVAAQLMGLTLKSPVKVIVCAASVKFMPNFFVVSVMVHVSALACAV